MDFTRPLEALIPGATGRLLGALARVQAELPVSTLATVAGVGRTRASAVLKELAELGVISRRQVGPTVLVRLERANAAGQLVARLAGLRIQVIEEMRELARDLDPPPLSLTLFGSLARGVGVPACQRSEQGQAQGRRRALGREPDRVFVK